MAPSPFLPGRAVLFDLDGTVWDSLPGIVRSLAHALAELDLPVPPDADLARDVGPPLPEMLRLFGVTEEQVLDGVEIYRDRYRRLGEFECEVYPGARELLDELRADGWRLATATSKGVEPTHRMLAHFELDHRFDVIAAAPMLARGHRKADVIEEALAGLALAGPEGIVMVGDRSYDIEGGRHHGLRTIGVTWGYGTPEELRAAGADRIVSSFEELATAIADG